MKKSKFINNMSVSSVVSIVEEIFDKTDYNRWFSLKQSTKEVIDFLYNSKDNIRNKLLEINPELVSIYKDRFHPWLLEFESTGSLRLHPLETTEVEVEEELHITRNGLPYKKAAENIFEQIDLTPKQQKKALDKLFESATKGLTRNTTTSIAVRNLAGWLVYDNLKTLPLDTKIKILPSAAVSPRRLHQTWYYHIITVAEAIRLGFFINGCQCGFEIISSN